MKATQSLKREHELIRKAIDVLDAMAARVAAHDPVPPESIVDLLDFLTGFADLFHHAKEESILYPELETRGAPDDRGPLRAMAHEHDEGRALVRTLREAIGDIAHCEPGRRRFVEAARAYSALLQAHIDKEAGVLLPLADRLLDSAGDARVADAFASYEQELLTEGEEDRLTATLGRLTRQFTHPTPGATHVPHG